MYEEKERKKPPFLICWHVVLFSPLIFFFIVSRTPPPLESSDKDSIGVTDDQLNLGKYFTVVIMEVTVPSESLEENN